jgi:D-alanyl-D-alanine carboxypeptidase/D-alanyl-D-alanine-endopeptidase (penicillin-binding protein 4)
MGDRTRRGRSRGPARRPPSRLLAFLGHAGVLVALAAAGCATAGHRAGAGGADFRGHVGRALDALLDGRPVERAFWGVEFVDARTGDVLYARNAERHFVPASNMKLIVTATALDQLGSDYTYRTSIYTNGRIEGGTLVGDLILYGRGDPNLSGRYTTGPTAIFTALADSLRARGVERVEGRVVADESYFDADYTRPDWEAYDLLWWYAAPVSALSFNDNSIDFTIRPGPVGQPPAISGTPATSFWSLQNTALTVARLDSTDAPLDFTRVPGTNRVIAYGAVEAGSPEDTESFSVVNPAGYTATVFRETLEASGISVAVDSVSVISDPALSPVDSSSTLLAEHVSPPLDRVISSINKRSQNWHAEQLLKTLGKLERGTGSFRDGIAVEREFLERIGIAPEAVEIRDASGLSANNLVTPHALTTVLRVMLRHPHADVFFTSLPAAGGDGSLRTRFAQGPAAGRVYAKTGSIQNVNSLSGYLVPTPSDTLAFSILANNHGLDENLVIAAIDSAVSIMAGAYH